MNVSLKGSNSVDPGVEEGVHSHRYKSDGGDYRKFWLKSPSDSVPPPGGGGALPYKSDGDDRRKFRKEPQKGDGRHFGF